MKVAVRSVLLFVLVLVLVVALVKSRHRAAGKIVYRRFLRNPRFINQAEEIWEKGKLKSRLPPSNRLNSRRYIQVYSSTVLLVRMIRPSNRVDSRRYIQVYSSMYDKAFQPG